MKDALGHGSNPHGMHASGIDKAVPRVGEEFTSGKDRYKVKATDWQYKMPEDEGTVLAWRFIRTTQKYSGNAYRVRP